MEVGSIKTLLLQSINDPSTLFQYEMLIRQKPVREVLRRGMATILAGPNLTREAVLRELSKPYGLVYVGSHGDDYTIRGAGREVVLKRGDRDLFKNKRAYAYVCNSFESGIFDKAVESLTYFDKFIFPKPKVNPAYNVGVDEWHVLQLGFFPINEAIRYTLKGKKPNFLEIYKETMKNYMDALKNVKTDEADFALRNNMQRLKYRSNYL